MTLAEITENLSQNEEDALGEGQDFVFEDETGKTRRGTIVGVNHDSDFTYILLVGHDEYIVTEPRLLARVA